MKIEMGESLFYSWLRHVKECQIVQTNWKPSPSWQMQQQDVLERFMLIASEHFQSKYGYTVIRTKSLSQLITQAEIDALGISLSENGRSMFAVDVAFHESGLNYGDRTETVSRIIMKFIRSALCMIGYFGDAAGEIIFASPKVSGIYLGDLAPCIEDINKLFHAQGFSLTARIIANDAFNDLVLKPILIASDGVADTSELFLRSYQLVKMFGNGKPALDRQPRNKSFSGVAEFDSLSELKIGKIAQTLFRDVLESGSIEENELSMMQTRDYSKQRFDLDFPLLVRADSDFESLRYYVKPLVIRGVSYRLCSQWYEVPANNDRPLLLAWLSEHGVVI